MNPHIPYDKVPCAAIISEVSITVLCTYAVFTLLNSSMNQELFEKHICDQSSSHYEK